jgi:hypothetical protein
VPATANHGIETVALECRGKVYRELLGKKNAHPQECRVPELEVVEQ